jgi:type VI secretion system protein ImpB
MRYMDGKVAAEGHLRALLADPKLMAALKDRAPATSEDSAPPSATDDTKS